MKGFVELTTENGILISVNIGKIVDFASLSKSAFTTISYSENYFYKVKESYEEIKELIKKAQE